MIGIEIRLSASVRIKGVEYNGIRAAIAVSPELEYQPACVSI